MYCFLYREMIIGKMQEDKEKAIGKMQEEKKKAEAAVKSSEELKVVIGKMNDEMRYCGFYFKQNNGRFEVYHTDEWHAENKARRLEIDKLRKDRDHYDEMTDKMIKLAKKRNLEFEFKNGRVVALVALVSK